MYIRNPYNYITLVPQMNSSSCEASCRFLEQLKNFSSIFVGDGSRLPRLGIPTVTNKNLTSLSLQWDPVQNASGTSVYLVAMEITGDYDLPSPFYFVRVCFHFFKSTSVRKFSALRV